MTDLISVSQWVDDFTRHISEHEGIDVPCGDCAACCESSMFILLRPEDSAAKRAIPSELRFVAPGMPEGFEVMGYDQDGRCPMHRRGCTIYAERPLTCRQFDCRVFPVTETTADEQSMQSIYRASQRMQFLPQTGEDQRLIQRLSRIAQVLHDDAKSSTSTMPRHSSSRASMAIEVHEYCTEQDWLMPSGDFRKQILEYCAKLGD